MTSGPTPAVRPAPSWRQRLVGKLLYGSNVDRNAKARARVGFAIVGFFLVYAAIGARLVMFAVAPEARGERRTAAQDAFATARPDIVDRNGEILATDVKAPSLFGEPRRIIDKDEAIELLTATLPDLPVGARLRILPNHACATGAQHDRYHVVTGQTLTGAVWPRINGW